MACLATFDRSMRAMPTPERTFTHWPHHLAAEDALGVDGWSA